MVTAYGIQDFGSDAPKEVRGGYDDVWGGIAYRSSVPGQRDNVASEGEKELMPPPEFGRCTGVDIQVGGEDIGRKGTVQVGQEIIGKGRVGADIDGSAGEGEGGKEDSKDKVLRWDVEEGLWPNREVPEVANGHSAPCKGEGVVGTLELVGGHMDLKVGLQESFIKEEGIHAVLG